jgi:hypothetical protein
MSAETEREAIELLAGLLADAAKTGVVFPSTFVRVKRGAMPGARPPAKEPVLRVALQNAAPPEP